MRRSRGCDVQVDRLTDRELHVFQLIGIGLGTGEIARQLGLSRKTVECYNDHLKEKLGCENAAALKERAAQWMAAIETAPPSVDILPKKTETGDVPLYSANSE